MIQHPHDRRRENVENLRGGNGSVFFDYLIEPEVFGGKGRMFAATTLKPGCSIGRHQHVNDFEVYYILAGKGLYDDNGTRAEVAQGDVCLARDGEFHGIENTGPDDLVIVAMIIYT
jgi:quercetin dioxygenase-like cupin family protein